MVSTKYVHGYSDREVLRLNDQAATLDDIIHNDSLFFKDIFVLEAGCGVGAQTKIKAMKNPDSNLISEDSIEEAKGMIKSIGH